MFCADLRAKILAGGVSKPRMSRELKQRKLKRVQVTGGRNGECIQNGKLTYPLS